MTTTTSPDNIVIWTTADPGSLVAESAAQAASIQAALTSRGGTFATPALLDANSTSGIGARAYMTSPGTGIEAMTWEAYAGAGAGLDWHIVDTVRSDTKAHLDAFIAVIAATTDLRFVEGGLAYVAATRLFYQFTSTAGAYRPLEGLVPIYPTSVAGSGVTRGTYGRISYSGATTISVNGCFTSEFANYLIRAEGTSGSASTQSFRLRAAGVDASGTNYTSRRRFTNASAWTVDQFTQSSMVLSGFGATVFTTTIELFGPALAVATRLTTHTSEISSGQPANADLDTYHSLTTAYDGFTITATQATTGTLRIFGYNDM